MIERLSIQNFRSIRNTEINLSRLSVIVGANGSGKSNLIKAIQFISSIAKHGLDRAVSHAGGIRGIIPASATKTDKAELITNIDYSVNLEKPFKYPDSFPEINVTHNIQFARHNLSTIYIVSEYLKFQSALEFALTRKFRHPDRSNSILALMPIPIDYYSVISEFIPTQITLEHVGQKPPQINSNFPRTETLFPILMDWLGTNFFVRSAKSVDEFEQALHRMLSFEREEQNSTPYQSRNKNSFIYSQSHTALSFCEQRNALVKRLLATNRYDLLLNELRQEQQIDESNQIASDGKNLPATLNSLLKGAEFSEARERIYRTLGDIAPHVRGLNVQPLRAGKEFVEFIETTSGNVESWEQSDGTLRALAILVCLETQPSNSTILIEEPERDLHPWAVRSLMQHIREVATIRDLQILLTTHSPQVLEESQPEEVIVATRTAQEGTILTRLTEMFPQGTFEMGDIGRLWVKGLISGVPQYE